ncbi:MAG: hypothetical protein IJ890_00190 [Clostridia bacterium]|nr:hypothetical protein [Clostridia bacterium]
MQSTEKRFICLRRTIFNHKPYIVTEKATLRLNNTIKGDFPMVFNLALLKTKDAFYFEQYIKSKLKGINEYDYPVNYIKRLFIECWDMSSDGELKIGERKAINKIGFTKEEGLVCL